MIKNAINADQLLRFCTAVYRAADTPALIHIVAKDEEFVRISQALAFPLEDGLLNLLREVCHKHGFDAGRISRQVRSAAQALQLAPAEGSAQDYYAMLGVPPEADTQTIKHAFRKKAKSMHPDKSKSDGEAFMQLHRAYVQLSDDQQRRYYDNARGKKGRWIESSGAKKIRTNLHAFSGVIVTVLVMLVALAFILDQVYNETSIFERIVPTQATTQADKGGETNLVNKADLTSHSN